MKEKVTSRKVFLSIALSWTVVFVSQIFALLVYHFDNYAKSCTCMTVLTLKHKKEDATFFQLRIRTMVFTRT